MLNYCVGRDGVQSRVLMHCGTALAEILAACSGGHWACWLTVRGRRTRAQTCRSLLGRGSVVLARPGSPDTLFGSGSDGVVT
jgi:hypothetical protein